MRRRRNPAPLAATEHFAAVGDFPEDYVEAQVVWRATTVAWVLTHAPRHAGGAFAWGEASPRGRVIVPERVVGWSEGGGRPRLDERVPEREAAAFRGMLDRLAELADDATVARENVRRNPRRRSRRR